jgi:hypothetical protein
MFRGSWALSPCVLGVDNVHPTAAGFGIDLGLQVVNLLLEHREVLPHYSPSTVVRFLRGCCFGVLLPKEPELVRFRCVCEGIRVNVGHAVRVQLEGPLAVVSIAIDSNAIHVFLRRPGAYFSGNTC